ncbi:MAG TPA: 1-(5-phosphoribosyl)-5-((5-phosphoribosylamino)methylideneamino)imidazole-4-carboxamide isomerase [Deltaproteobacteria bacterium]|nr:MAG: 1-(5-phosphoribosyl)-5-[(5-phosphoribosylamino)methylideneamino]imidazole-4-carboxamide isomerase [Deltaproteobacteria bacterium GWA2_55_82]OGQ62282.1 MAG: 1-(5-phosphoribosyl)-5-[(5-phosphoribosylamino)methylideneamino]imidazole-4-carboxamide isomerase [Deltaproteobacteria bacterium RIFCSPLOWO2_02_FULL_55_12]OIJ74394.1 MAG: 1-(5-phosphoribosyl)-5-[(5-phosphoribosylamino)methylideneamino]imidazole-4-carboxamide isomerase [Deltaproteobacteria bacterium GWC2_55_46]HBG47043.1 1-(5-phosphori
MLIFPAIDIKNGRCVRLTQGRMDAETVYSDEPWEVAKRWESEGAEVIHLVDLDGAVEGNARNLPVIKKIIEKTGVPVQIGGGIRDVKTAETYLAIPHVKRIIIGTAAYENPAFVNTLTRKYPGRVAVGIDAKDGKVAIKGWVTVTSERATDLARKLEGAGVASIIYTDISKDGMLAGPNVEATREMAESVSIPVVASGGISSLKDIESYRGVALEGMIIGKALYAGNIRLKEAIKAAKGL